MSTTKKQRRQLEEHANSLLRNYPPDTAYVVNGQPVTAKDITNYHHEEQRTKLRNILANTKDIIKPALIWTFYNDSFIYGGWWLYVRTLKRLWKIDPDYYGEEKIALKIMSLYPCGLLPILEDFYEWKKQFAKSFPVVNKKRPENQGMKTAWAKVSANGKLFDIELSKNAL